MPRLRSEAVRCKMGFVVGLGKANKSGLGSRASKGTL